MTQVVQFALKGRCEAVPCSPFDIAGRLVQRHNCLKDCVTRNQLIDGGAFRILHQLQVSPAVIAEQRVQVGNELELFSEGEFG